MNFEEAQACLSQPYSTRAIRFLELVNSERRFVPNGTWRYLRTVRNEFSEYDYGYKQFWNGGLNVKYNGRVVKVRLESGARPSEKQLAFNLIQELTGFRYRNQDELHFRSIRGSVGTDRFDVELHFSGDMTNELNELRFDCCAYSDDEPELIDNLPLSFDGLRRMCELQRP